MLSDETRALALVSVDLLALPSEFVNRVRAGIEGETGISADAVMIASTHTHAGPVTIRTFFNPEESVDSGYLDFLAQSVEQSVSRAWRIGSRESRRRCEPVDGVGVNRRSPDLLPIDEEVGIIKVDDFNDRTRAVLINYSCHPTVLGPDNKFSHGRLSQFR